MGDITQDKIFWHVDSSLGAQVLPNTSAASRLRQEGDDQSVTKHNSRPLKLNLRWHEHIDLILI